MLIRRKEHDEAANQAETIVEHQIYFYSSDHCIPPPPHKTASRLKEHAEDGGDKEKYDVLFN